jgi:ribonuclease T2
VDVLDYFNTAIAYFRRHTTWEWLAGEDIQPSNKTAYTLSDIQGALREASGAVPYLGCSGPRFNETAAGKGSKDNGRTVLSEVWYYMHVRGRPQEMHTRPVDASSVGSDTSCAASKNAIWYYERSRGSEEP